jgi:hypothetical protein
VPYADDIEKILSQLSSLHSSLNASSEAGEFHKLSLALNKLGHGLREQMQSETAGRMQTVIRKLDTDEPIDADDRELIRLWMISDAEFYVQMEKDFQDWLAELDRILANLERLRSSKQTLETIGKLSGSVRDGLRVLADVVFFKEQQERVGRFEEATQRLHTDDKRAIARILRNKLLSDQA